MMTEGLAKQPRAVADAARQLGLDLDIREYPGGTRTAADAARAIGCGVEQIVKSLVFMADKEPVLVLTSGANRVDVVKVAKQTGTTDVRKADAEEVRAATGYAIGGTPPFGHPRQLTILVDPHLTTLGTLWAAAGTPRHVFPISSEDLLRATGGAVADVALEQSQDGQAD
jgi:Cys-tRNA(Pro) deacylase